jgi:hypothetical protein
MKLISIVLLAFASFTALADDSETLADSDGTLDRIEAFCKQEYKREPSLIHACMNNQMGSLRDIESYQMRKWPDIAEDHPVTRLLKDSAKRAAVVVDGKPWVNWSLAKLYFKRSMQTWLEAEGKSDPDLDYGL